ncbi:TPA: PAS domain S-box protein [Klebsiella oxytoca]|uniref:PAS domain S-box protein n=1 Tax=Klebsiella oxytoca TaxID=571 RepID=A0AAN5RG84_KLEOX|nr:PAS domain S-box protein [Klebsiella oxytoca]
MAFTLQKFLRVINEAVIISDGAGVITCWNPAAERLFGFTEHEAVGDSLNIIIPEKYRQRHGSGYAAAIRSGTTKYGMTLLYTPALKRDGSIISVAFSVALIPGNASTAPSVVAIVRDETSRFNKERQLRKQLTEMEARLMASQSCVP